MKKYDLQIWNPKAFTVLKAGNYLPRGYTYKSGMENKLTVTGLDDNTLQQLERMEGVNVRKIKVL